MASAYTPLGVQLMVTGEKAGLWGGYTNTNLEILEQIAGGYTTQAVADGTTTALAVLDGTTGATIATSTIKMTGSLTGASGLSVPDDITGMKYLVINATTGGQTVTFKTAGGTGVSWSTTTAKLLYHDGTNIVDTGFMASFDLVDDTSPQLGGDLDVNGQDIVSTSNADIDIIPNGTGVARAKDGGGTTAAVKIAGKETMWVPATAMYASTTNGAEATQTELTAGNPELKTFDFDTSTAESVQFNVSFPKSWDEGVVTFQTFWSASATDTGTGGFTLAGCSVASDVDYDLAFGTPVANTALAASGTQDDLMVNVVSGDVTIASAAAATNTIFRLVRDTGTDTNTGDLRLVGIKIFYTTDAANDA